MHWLDPDQLPEVSGSFERFLINPHGDADGMILSDGTEVHFPPHMSAELYAAIRKGERPKLKIRGVRLCGGDLIAASPSKQSAVVASSTTERQRSTKKNDARAQRGKSASRCRRKRPSGGPCTGPKRELRRSPGESQVVRFPPHEAEQLSHLALRGRTLAAAAKG